MRAAMKSNTDRFSARRMVEEYVDRLYSKRMQKTLKD